MSKFEPEKKDTVHVKIFKGQKSQKLFSNFYHPGALFIFISNHTSKCKLMIFFSFLVKVNSLYGMKHEYVKVMNYFVKWGFKI